MHQKPLTSRIIGFISSLFLTLGAYFLIVNPEFFHLNTHGAILAILVFATFQALAQLIFFIDIWREKGALWNLGVFLSTCGIILIIIVFSIWIMHHLDYNMMPK